VPQTRRGYPCAARQNPKLTDHRNAANHPRRAPRARNAASDRAKARKTCRVPPFRALRLTRVFPSELRGPHADFRIVLGSPSICWLKRRRSVSFERRSKCRAPRFHRDLPQIESVHVGRVEGVENNLVVVPIVDCVLQRVRCLVW
jgi:hypothetical protein